MILTGIVVHGKKLGQRIGFPTANLKVIEELEYFKTGVYTVLVKHETNIYSGVMNVGYRPTVDGLEQKKLTIEIHIIDFNEQIYGHSLKVFPISYIRCEKRFNSLDQLKAQISQDTQIANQISSVILPTYLAAL